MDDRLSVAKATTAACLGTRRTHRRSRVRRRPVFACSTCSVAEGKGVVGLMNKQNPKDFGNNMICNISDPSLMESAKKAGKTRAQMSMRVAEKEIDGGIVVVGNAPTALLEVMEMFREGLVKPALVVGMPVGFVSAVESKDELSKTEIPFITNIGRKGGSPCASAIINALYKLLRQGII